MAPFVPSSDIPDLGLSSLELDARSTVVDIIQVSSKNIFKREALAAPPSPVLNLHSLTARSQSTKTPDHGGAVNPNDINMKGIQALIAIIGTSFVLAIIWFFFWAKNGGFKWQKGDWDDYKSTVLRKKGPNGTTLSNASKSTKLGGGSVVGEGYSDGTASQWGGTMTETMTDLSSEAPIIKENRKFKNKETAKERKVREARQANWEGGHDEDMQAYIREKPAQVGGINRDSEALHYGTDYTDTEGSAVHSQTHRTSRPSSQAPGPRHVSTTAPRQRSPEKHQARRDFSFGNEDNFSTVSSAQPEPPTQTYPDLPPQTPPHRPGRYHQSQQPQPQPQQQSDPRRPSQYQYPRTTIPGGYQESISDVQSHHTKTYHHPIPGLGNSGPANQSQQPPTQQQGRGGYRRDRRDSFD